MPDLDDLFAGLNKVGCRILDITCACVAVQLIFVRNSMMKLIYLSNFTLMYPYPMRIS